MHLPGQFAVFRNIEYFRMYMGATFLTVSGELVMHGLGLQERPHLFCAA